MLPYFWEREVIEPDDGILNANWLRGRGLCLRPEQEPAKKRERSIFPGATRKICRSKASKIAEKNPAKNINYESTTLWLKKLRIGGEK